MFPDIFLCRVSTLWNLNHCRAISKIFRHIAIDLRSSGWFFSGVTCVTRHQRIYNELLELIYQDNRNDFTVQINIILLFCCVSLAMYEQRLITLFSISALTQFPGFYSAMKFSNAIFKYLWSCFWTKRTTFSTHQKDETLITVLLITFLQPPEFIGDWEVGRRISFFMSSSSFKIQSSL